jgi:O-antigen ligase
MEGSAASRIALIRYGWAMFRDHPLGVGHKGHEAISPYYVPATMLSNGTRAAHNTFMQILVEQGIVGAVLYVILLLWVARQLWILKRMDKQGLSSELALYRAGIGSALAGAFIAELFLGSLKAEVNIWLLALLAAFSAVCEQSLEEKRQATVPIDGTASAVPAEARPNRFALALHSEYHRR